MVDFVLVVGGDCVDVAKVVKYLNWSLPCCQVSKSSRVFNKYVD